MDQDKSLLEAALFSKKFVILSSSCCSLLSSVLCFPQCRQNLIASLILGSHSEQKHMILPGEFVQTIRQSQHNLYVPNHSIAHIVHQGQIQGVGAEASLHCWS